MESGKILTSSNQCHSVFDLNKPVIQRMQVTAPREKKYKQRRAVSNARNMLTLSRLQRVNMCISRPCRASCSSRKAFFCRILALDACTVGFPAHIFSSSDGKWTSRGNTHLSAYHRNSGPDLADSWRRNEVLAALKQEKNSRAR